MTTFGLASAALYAVGRGAWGLRDHGALQPLFVAGYLFLAGWVVLALRARTGHVSEGNVAGAMAALGAAGSIVAGFAVALPYWLHLLRSALEWGQRSATGVDRMRVEPSFDLAEKAERERRLEDARRLYLEAADARPDEPEPRRRAGEAALALGQVEKGLVDLRAALLRTAADEDYASLAFRIAELLELRSGRPAEAAAELERAVHRLAGTRMEAYARERLSALKHRASF